MKTKTANCIRLVCSTVLFVASISSTLAASLPRIDGEYARPSINAAKAAARLSFIGDVDMQSNSLFITLPSIDPAKIEGLKKSNRAEDGKLLGGAMQIGIPRPLRDELSQLPTAASLKWNNLPNGAKVAYLRLTSVDAKAVRVGLNIASAPDGVELRAMGAPRANLAASVADAHQLMTLRDADGIYWTAITEGQTQLIEISAPAGFKENTFQFTIDSVAHIFGTPALKFADAKSFSDCNVDAICAAQTEGFVDAKNGVAMIAFQASNGQGGITSATFMCSATLLNDNDPTSQTPYLLTSNQCISSQPSANTIFSFWFFENATCANPRVQDANINGSTIVDGGATLLFSDRNNDVAFLRMNNLAPGGAFFSGWDANPIAVGESVTIIHHALGDPKRVTIGLVDLFRTGFAGLNGTFTSPTYTTGTTSSGSTGAGILTVADGKYFLRGSLVGGPATCENRNQPSSAGNYAYYSRFDAIYQSIKQYLMKDAAPPSYTDIWWGGAAESGWGIQITQHLSGNIFATWYTYDQAGNQLFVVMSGCDLIPFNGSVCSGRLFKTTGTPFNDASFGGSTTTYIGSGTLTFTDADNAIFDYTINASAANNQTTLQKKITRFPFGVGVAAFPNDASDIYFNPDAPGWGYSLAQHGTAAFGVIYHYDENRNPMFLTMYVPAFNGNNGGASSATLYRTRSNGASHYLSPTWRASDITNVPVSGSGTATVGVFPGGVNLSFTITSGTTFTQQRTLSKLPF